MTLAAGEETGTDPAVQGPAADKQGETEAKKIIENGDTPECPDCGAMLVLQEGCRKCGECGWSKC